MVTEISFNHSYGRSHRKRRGLAFPFVLMAMSPCTSRWFAGHDFTGSSQSVSCLAPI